MTIAASSSFRRYGQRDERRRRLLTDDLYDQEDRSGCRVWTEDAPAPRKSENYGDAEFLQQQLRLLDLVPQRLIVLAVLFSAAAAVIVGLEFAYVWMVGRAAAGETTLTTLDVAAKGSLACWFSSLMLLAAAVVALLIYSVRRHRTDDYQGRYRIWIWAAGGCFLLATDQAAGLREAFREMMISLTGTPLLGNGDPWWIVAYVIIFGAIGSRLLMDVRFCPLSVCALSGAAVAHGLTVAQRFGLMVFDGGANKVMYLAGSEMAGNLLLLAAFGSFARHVVLDAEGLLPRRRRNEPEDQQCEDDQFRSAGPGRWRKIDPPHVAPKPIYQRAATPATVSLPATAATPSPVARKLTKAERKAMKKRLLQQRMERERKCG